MKEAIIEMLKQSGVLAHVILPSEIALLPSSLEPAGPAENQGGGILIGLVLQPDFMVTRSSFPMAAASALLMAAPPY